MKPRYTKGFLTACGYYTLVAVTTILKVQSECIDWNCFTKDAILGFTTFPWFFIFQNIFNPNLEATANLYTLSSLFSGLINAVILYFLWAIAAKQIAKLKS